MVGGLEMGPLGACEGAGRNDEPVLSRSGRLEATGHSAALDLQVSALHPCKGQVSEQQ